LFLIRNREREREREEETGLMKVSMDSCATDGVASFSGLSWNLNEDINRLNSESKITRLEISDLRIDVELASIIVLLIQKHGGSITHLSLLDCTGHIDVIVSVSLMTGLKSLEIGTPALSVCAHSLGVGLLTSANLKRLVLHSGKKRYFTLVADSVASLGQGLIGSKSLESLTLKRCRFGDSVAIRSTCNALKSNSFLQHIVLTECLSGNGQTLPEGDFSLFLDALKDSQSLITLDTSINSCLGGTSVADIIKFSSIRHLSLSHQMVDLSGMVGALGSTRSLESINLAFNRLDDGDMPFLAAAMSCNTSVKYVNLSGNNVSNTGISILASKLPSMRGLEHLVLTDNPFGGNGTSQLRRSLQLGLNYSLMHLELDVTVPHHASCMYFPDLNWMRRRFLFEENVAPALWPFLLERANRLFEEPNGSQRRANIVFCILQKSTALFPF